MPSLICDHARLVEVKNVSADVSERQALSNLIRCSSSCEPIVKYDSLSTLMSRVNVGARRAGLEHCRNVPLFPVISDWERSGNRLNRLLSCVGMSKLLEWFLLFLATMASIHAEDRRLAKDGGEVRIEVVYALLRAMRAALRCGRCGRGMADRLLRIWCDRQHGLAGGPVGKCRGRRPSRRRKATSPRVPTMT